MSAADPFDSLLTIEDTLYTDAYAQGIADGARAGRIEGRVFGLEKGFEKFTAMGRLNGRACVWGARMPSFASMEEKISVNKSKKEDGVKQKSALPPLQPNTRLQKHISMLHGLTDPLTFSTSNTEDAVADFDDRFRRAGAKAKIIERIIGESSDATVPDAASPKGRKTKIAVEGKKEENIEDFTGSRFLS
ncbi:hypothetical protein CC78DRAFT_458650 [Lojkania enalia]|uniref:Essential protein Yae1 N-terminal domain-containing protein n=1 Tax=Lojkania enalia TaxID=147567 RepID=A0A9P4KDM8_9PLEO|nr:hypothetical protein CC78DRAFT_458650 [Didymosphaeria enalia]